MQITKEYLEGQIEGLSKQHEQHIANANAVGGAIQVYKQLLQYEAMPEPVDEQS